MPVPRITVVITTRNRREEVTLAIHSCLQQTCGCEIIVIDDASTDGTSDWIRQHFPQVRLITRQKPCDSCINRNEGFKTARSPFVVSLDDDSFFSSPDTMQQIADKFEQYPEAAILSLAYVEPRQERTRMMANRPDTGAQMRGFVACAAAFRMDMIRQIGLYQEVIRRQGEERDLAIRVLENNNSIIFVDTPPVIHLYSPKRNHAQMSYLGFRNNILFCWMRIPSPDCLFKAITTTFQILIYKFSLRGLPQKLLSLGAGWIGAITYWKERCPVSRMTYKRFRSLPNHGPTPLNDAEQSQYLLEIEKRTTELNSLFHAPE